MKVSRVAVVVSHPIQHFCPQYSSWAKIDGVHLKVFFASRHGLDPYEDKNFGITVQWDQILLDFPHEFLPGAAGRAIGAEVDCEELGTRLAEFEPDTVVVYGYSQPLQRRATDWAQHNAKPLIMIADSELRSHRSWPKRLAKSLILPRTLRRMSAFLTVGDANESYYRHYGVDDRKLVRGFFPIDVKAYGSLYSQRANVREALRRELGIPDDHTILLTVGKLVSWKRQEDLVWLANRFRGQRRDITIIIAGTGPDQQKLSAMATNIGPGGVIFAGFVPPQKLMEYYAASDIYVHCSSVEPHSLAISEAIYLGLPVVLSDRCGSFGPTDDVRHGSNGLVYACGNVDALHAALAPLIDRPKLRASMGTESRLIAEHNQTLAHGKALVQALRVIGVGVAE